MPEGKYFYIHTDVNGFVLDINGESHSPGTNVITWPKKEGDCCNQLWYLHLATGTIRSKMHDFCLDISDSNTLVVNPFDEDRGDQKWEIAGSTIRNRDNESRVLDVAGATASPAARVCAWEHHGKINQQWTFSYIEAKYFYIVSKLHGKVMDIKHQNAEPGGKVCMYGRSEGSLDSQLWYENKQGVIASKLNDLVMDSSHKNKVRLQQYEEGNEHQAWIICEDRICLCKDHDQALDIKEGSDENGAKIICYEWHGSENQRWQIEYAEL